MISEESHPEKPDGLTIRPSTGLISLPEGGSPALSEIISRSLAHIQAGRALPIHERRAGEEQEFEIAPGVKIVMCWIPPGEFLMGSTKDEVGRRDKEIQHRVTITQGFWLAKTLTTQAQWEAVMGNNPSHFNGTNLPVESVSWNEISEPGGFMDKANRFAVAGGIFSLPTEAQWEYACRAGATTALNNRKNLTTEYGMCLNLDEVAWYGMNSDRKTQPVGQKKANACGLLDMQGNVWEWCMDWCEDYTTGAQVDPQGPISGSYRVNRGGGWYCYANGCRVATRSFFNPGGTVNSIGFRIACSSIPSSVQKCDDVGACIFNDGKFHPLPKGIWAVQ